MKCVQTYEIITIFARQFTTHKLVMVQRTSYLPPVTEIIRLQGREHILNLSNYGNTDSPGSGFGDGDIIDIPDIF